MRTWQKGLAVFAAASSLAFFFLAVDLGPRVEYVPDPAPAVEEDTVPLPPDAYGIPMAGYALQQGQVKGGETFGGLLAARGVGQDRIHGLVELALPHFDVRRMRAGHPYAFIFKEDEALGPDYFVYEMDPASYLVFQLHDSLSVKPGHRPIREQEHSIACSITGALYNDLARAGADPALAIQLAEVFAWTVDFYRIRKDDMFSVVYRERTVDGERYGLPVIVGARYTSGDVVKEAYRFAQADGVEQFYDDQGKSLKKAFLQAPLKFSRITSGFSGRRLHPVQRVMKAHLGTDYAAPYGTPILSVGDGIVEKTGRTGGNGNFVKIRHNGTYSTQYLHMRKILVKQGAAVQQGQVIGEVGSTGLATGPHVCFRFWKNGVQVDHRKEEFPNTEPLAAELMPAFKTFKEPMRARLQAAEKQARGRVVHF